MKTELRQAIFSVVVAVLAVLSTSYVQGFVTRKEYDQYRVERASIESQVVTELKNISSTLQFMKTEFIEHIKVHK